LQEKLKGVVKLAASCAAFAAILSTGGVVTWGKADFGGNSSQVQDQLRYAFICRDDFLQFSYLKDPEGCYLFT
jgi:hypothetical protein